MAELLKDKFDYLFISNLGDSIRQVIPDFDKEGFLKLIFNNEWESLELKGRIDHITITMHRFLPEDYERSVELLLKITERIRSKEPAEQNYFYSFLPNYVEKFGFNHFSTSVSALESITLLSSAEFAVRPFILANPEAMLAKMLLWSKHPDHRVRRLSSEGCRPSLPWAAKLSDFQRDPSPILPILESLKNDPSLYVRKSVANNLNDISKFHPDLVISTWKNWYGQSPNVDWVVRHSARTLIKKSHPEVLSFFGIGDSSLVDIIDFQLENSEVKMGDETEFSFKMIVEGHSPSKIRISFVVDYVKKNGKSSPKVFHLAESDFKPGTFSFSKKMKFLDLTTRKHYPGTHRVSIMINGKILKSLDFKVLN